MKKVIEVAKSVGTKFSLLALSVGSIVGIAKAAPGDLGDINGTPIEGIKVFGGDLSVLVTNLINIILLLAGVLAVVYLIWGGISYVTAGGDAEKASKGRVAITNAIIGIIIIIAALAIYSYITGSSVIGFGG